MSGPEPPPAGPLCGLRVLELASDRAAFGGKLLADLGADVIVVEPPGGHRSRRYGPNALDRQDPNTSLFWWYYHTSKRGLELDLEAEAGQDGFRRLVRTVDLVLEGEAPDRLGRLGIDHEDLRADQAELIWVSVTPYGRGGPRSAEPATDLTLQADGGVVWNNGYDDHTVPPVRGRGNQAAHVAGVFAAEAALVAVLARQVSGRGQHVDVNMDAALNVTTESGTFVWLVSEKFVKRQTGRHAGSKPTLPTQTLAADGRYVQTGFPPVEGKDFATVIDWLEALGVAQEFGDLVLLQMAVERGGVDPRVIESDPVTRELFGAGREALSFIAARLSAYDFFVGAQARDMQCGIVYTADEALEDPHTVARGFPVEVHHPELGRSFRYPGAPFKMSASPWAISRRSPLVGEHNQLLEDLPAD